MDIVDGNVACKQMGYIRQDILQICFQLYFVIWSSEIILFERSNLGHDNIMVSAPWKSVYIVLMKMVASLCIFFLFYVIVHTGIKIA